MRKFSQALGVAAIAASALTLGSAHAWWGGGPGGNNWMNDWMGDGYGDFNMSMSGGGRCTPTPPATSPTRSGKA